MSAPAVPARDAEPTSHRQVLEALSGLLLVLFVALLSSTVVSTARSSAGHGFSRAGRSCTRSSKWRIRSRSP